MNSLILLRRKLLPFENTTNAVGYDEGRVLFLCSKLILGCVEMIDLKQYGYVETEAPQKGLLPARVTEHHRDHYMVVCEYGEAKAILKGSFVHNAQVRNDLPCVGDFVWIRYNGSGPSLIETLMPRRSKFSRADAFGHSLGHIKANHEQVVAANFDYVFIVTSLNRDFRVNRIMRYLTQTWQSGGLPVVILTKADLTDAFDEQISDVQQAAPGVPVHAVSAHTGFGMEALDEYLRPGKTVVFLGMSGVGKSSLLNALSGEDLAAVKETRRVDESKGGHTTTHRQLFMLPSGAMVIDTPGMRELGLFDAEEGISAGFADVEELFTQCRFNDCHHKTEPGCAVLNALADGTLSNEQWERYQAQKRESKYMDDKTAFMRERSEMHKSWAKSHKAEKRAMKQTGRLKR